jgi:hypothetical protein
MVADGVRLDEAVLVDHLRLQRDGAGVGEDAARIVHGARGHLDAGAQTAPVRTFVDHHLFACAEADLSSGGVQPAVVFDLFGDQEQRVVFADLDLSVIDDACERRHAGELPADTRAKVGRKRRGSGDEVAADADHGIGAEVKPVGVGKDDRAVGVEAAPDLRRVCAADAVKNDGMDGRLVERGGFAGLDVETVPVQNGELADVHVELRAAGLGTGGTGHDGHALGIGPEFQTTPGRQQRDRQPEASPVVSTSCGPVFGFHVRKEIKIGIQC